MRLLKWNNGDVCLVDAPEKIPPYAILSHTWGPKDTEVSFEDVINKEGKGKAGYDKIRFCGEQAQRDGLEYFWIDTCCIDKSSSAELSESLNSMFKWYRDSEACYVYLSDVSENQSQPGWELSFRNCKWFTRGWTLQELLAPAKIKFFTSKSEYLGDKESLGQLIHDITKIPIEALHGSCPLSKFATMDRCAWMNGRDTTRPEDQAYALLGIVDAYLPLMYGYGKDKAMLELHEAIYAREKQNISIVQVDQFLSIHHYSDARLRIQRLSGENLDMTKCYINLAVVRQTSENNTAPSNNETSPFDIFSRLRVHEIGRDRCVDLSKMFDSRHTSQGLTKAPRRILIRGRAGVGKTTLCKKIVFEFERRSLWNDLFDRVLWVPLRTLKTWSRDSLTLVDFFHHHYFRDDHRFGHILAERLGAEVQLGSGLGTRSRTLFILDGLDEVTETWNTDEPMHELLAKLLNQANAIITCRPHAQLPLDVDNPVDLELETVGFQPKQVVEYLAMVLPTPKDIKEIQSFLKRFAIVQGLARIPILLDALCYIWSDNAGINPTLQSMTNFYKYVQQQLMIKDSVRLGKRKAYVANHMGTLQLEDCFKYEVELLEKLAFTGMVNDMIEFEPKTRHAILGAFKGENDRILPDQSIRHLSFLRTSDPHRKGADVNYHFLHLTFQEFFAASYFVRQWISNSEDSVCYVDLKHGKGKKYEKVSSFLDQHKYNPRYDIFWRFVAGLLDDERDGDEVAKFFQAIDEYQSRDVLGPAHQRLVIHCLNEVSKDLASRRDLERRLKEWIIFEIRFTSNACLASEVGFPDHVLVDVLRQGRSDTNLLSSLSVAINSRVGISNYLQQELLTLLDDEDRLTRAVVSDALTMHISSPEVQEELLVRLGGKDPDIQQTAIDILRSQAGDPEVKQALLTLLGDKSVGVRRSAATALTSQAGDTEVQRALQSRLGDEDPTVRHAAAIALNSRCVDPEVRQVLLLALGDKDKDIGWLATRNLRSHSGVPVVQQELLARLDGIDPYSRQFAVSALRSQAGKREVQKALLTRLCDDEDPHVRKAIVDALSGQAGECEVQKALLTRLCDDEDPHVRKAIVDAFSSQAGECEVQKALLARLFHGEDRGVRWAAVYALRSQSGEPKVQQALLTQLNDKESSVRNYAARALGNQAGEPEVQEALLARLTDESSRVRWRVAQALSSHASESKVQQALLGRLNDDNKYVQSIAIKTLLRYQDKPLQTLSAEDRMIIIKDLVRMSFSQPFSWQVGSGASSLYTPWGLMKTSIADTESLSRIIERSRPAGYPVDDLQPVQPGSSSWFSSWQWIQNLVFRNGPT
ncbi:unnamed protein product [Clonostachys solani]|uniref:NACHT domain-containing protein n=1 Tax=Clonostachys solani TaxID=160281 RepID=A0A9P0EQQ3_9HYPO|nr:unnamed protein product [Clonostachys solani]